MPVRAPFSLVSLMLMIQLRQGYVCNDCESRTLIACRHCKKPFPQPQWYYGNGFSEYRFALQFSATIVRADRPHALPARRLRMRYVLGARTERSRSSHRPAPLQSSLPLLGPTPACLHSPTRARQTAEIRSIASARIGPGGCSSGDIDGLEACERGASACGDGHKV